jgi:hypothetical protein
MGGIGGFVGEPPRQIVRVLEAAQDDEVCCAGIAHGGEHRLHADDRIADPWAGAPPVFPALRALVASILVSGKGSLNRSKMTLSCDLNMPATDIPCPAVEPI